MLGILISLFLHLNVSASSGSLVIVVENIDIEYDETVRVGIYNTPSAFPEDDQQYQGKIQKASRTSLTFRFDQLRPGPYAVASFQDENNDGVLNTNFFGAPTEEYGFSNNPSIYFSAPSFETCQVKVIAGKETRITIEL